MSVLGAKIRRPDGVAKVTGTARYTADLAPAGALVARLLYAGHPYARIRSIDVTRARALPGVFAVITQSDVPRVRHGLMVKDRTLFAEGVVRYEADVVAAVAAIDDEAAEAACAAIEVDYEPLEPIVDPEQALADPVRLVHPDWDDYATAPGLIRDGNACGFCDVVKGDADAALAAADVVVTSRYRTDMAHPVPIEPRAVVAEWHGDTVSIWSSTQVPYVARAGVAECLQMPERDVRVVVTHLGGGFGGKCDMHYEPHVAALARVAGRPVKLVFDRRQEFLAPDMRHHPLTLEFTTGLDRSGAMLARRARIVLDTGAYAGHGPLIAEIATMMAAGPYRIPNIRIEGHTVYTTTGPSGSVRGPSGPQTVWAAEQHVDECARRLGIDPLEFRLNNLVEPGDEGPTGQIFTSSVAVKECLTKVAEMIGPRDDLPEGEGVGFGVGWWYSFPMASAASVRLNFDGSATIVTGAQENGSGAVMGLTILGAEELGLDPSQVSLVYQDTDAAPFDHGSGGSQTTYNNGRAVVQSAIQVRERLLQLAADHLEASPEDLELHNGRVEVSGSPETGVDFATLATNARFAGEQLVGISSPPPAAMPDALACAGRLALASFQAPSFFAHAIRVRVDPETGVVRVLDAAAAHDYGRIINPLGAEGQVEGGVVHGIGIALLEGSQHDAVGRQMNPNLLGYKLQTSADVPDIKVAFVGTPAPDGSAHGMKGVGEPPAVPTPAAVGNAITAAVGVQVQHLPMTPERVWAAIDEARS
ncbi:MAG TPA: xanthine dehydrogenase family protein molybdopterin-binding subunit [Baekduia sp.]|nr:xanthine dehydrogenase family protein molybdopterin-binding subunit [Baekduia sp.]